MSRIWHTTVAPAAGDTFTPRELNQDMRLVFGEFNGRLDRENIAANIITSDKLAVDAISERVYEESNTNRSITFSPREGLALANVPNDSGGDWIIEVTTPDCALVVEAGCTAGKDNLQYMLAVDGEIIAKRSWDNDHGDNTSIHLKGAKLVGAGLHTVEFLVVRPKVAATVSIVFGPRNFSVRVAKR